MNKLKVDIGTDYVRIYDYKNNEIVGWVQSEWLDDFEVVTSIFNAINLAHTNPEMLYKTIGKKYTE